MMGLIQLNNPRMSNNRVFDINGIGPTLNTMQGGRRQPLVKLSQLKSLMIRDGRDNRSTLRAGRVPELGIPGHSVRRLTPVECERLQSFPDNWTEGISNTQRYKCIGNAVTTNVITALMDRLYDE